jgi:hypothetical protein
MTLEEAIAALKSEAMPPDIKRSSGADVAAAA